LRASGCWAQARERGVTRRGSRQGERRKHRLGLRGTDVDRHSTISDSTDATKETNPMARLHAVGYDGDMGRALEGGQAGAAQSRGGLRAMWQRDAGQALLLTGRPRSSLTALREMMAELPLAGMAAGSAMWALDAMAEASALLGDVAAARGHLDELERRRPPGFQPPRTAGATWTAAAGGESRRAREIARQAATRHADRGALVHHALALYDIARLGATAEVTDELAQVAARCQGALVPALARAARCIAESDAEALDTESRELERQGTMLLAAELAARATALLRQRGRTGSAWITAHRAAELASRCEGARTPLLREVDDRDGLTEREREIAALVAQGLSDREVASRLQLSVRTVHSHLYHTYRKLGVSGREELARLLGGGTAPDERAH
jgi:DNA-binding CsgD family transcriptional regulator